MKRLSVSKGELLGWAGLGLGVAGLILATMLYQRRIWELDDYRTELAEIRTLLARMIAEVDRRLTPDRIYGIRRAGCGLSQGQAI
jgi:hypothetical protein